MREVCLREGSSCKRCLCKRRARARGPCAKVLVQGRRSCERRSRARDVLVQGLLVQRSLCRGGLCARARVHTRVCVMSVCVPLINPPLLINGGGGGIQVRYGMWGGFSAVSYKGCARGGGGARMPRVWGSKVTGGKVGGVAWAPGSLLGKLGGGKGRGGRGEILRCPL